MAEGALFAAAAAAADAEAAATASAECGSAAAAAAAAAGSDSERGSSDSGAEDSTEGLACSSYSMLSRSAVFSISRCFGSKEGSSCVLKSDSKVDSIWDSVRTGTRTTHTHA